ncbi:MAG: Fumarylacetoacetate hydrolase [Candidatus Eremiobacteraeota bacterium]|nr:Fumarylacetoacetate hydrolase [Candidatus Eremiobacteraeota bacterium]
MIHSKLTRHLTPAGSRWALNGRALPQTVGLDELLSLASPQLSSFLEDLPPGEALTAPLLPPIEPHQEVWASGVTYLRSREAREHESASADVYQMVYSAVRPELFMKSVGWRVKGDGEPVRIRRDSAWNVPEPELVLVLNSRMEIVGYTAGNDMSSRDIEGANPLYLPQAKIYDGSCALGPAIVLSDAPALRDLEIRLDIMRGGASVFAGTVSTSQMKRTFEELARWLGEELSFPGGALLMTGTGLVPGDDFTLAIGDVVHATVGELRLTNTVAS